MREKVIRIFVGAEDSSELEAMAKSRGKGWTVGVKTDSPNVRRALRRSNGAIVVVHGGTAGDCVARAAQEALARGAKKVIVPLPQIRAVSQFEGGTLPTRAYFFRKRFRLDGRDVDTSHPNLLVTPRVVWEEEKKIKRDNRN